MGIDRRQLLRRGVGVGFTVGIATVLAGAGCSVSDPRIDSPAGVGPSAAPSTRTTEAPPSGATAPPDPTPTFAGAVQAADAERRLAGLAAAMLAGPWRKSLGQRAELLAAIRDGHLAHATALLGAQPTDRPTGNPTTPIKHSAPKSLAAGLDRLSTAERAEAARYRRSASGTSGLGALLWASMSLAATGYADALGSATRVPVRKTKPAKPMPVLSDVAAMQQLVAQLHAVNYGYPMAIGQLPDGHRRNAAIRQLRSRRVLRDSLVTTLLARKVEVPVAAPAYVPTVAPRSSATAAELVRDMETRLAPYVGLWLAAVPTAPERVRALDTLAATVRTARSWGAPLRTWPGWV